MAHVVDSALAGYDKPDPRIFLHALAHTGPPPSGRCTSATSITPMSLGARGAGIHALLLDPYDDWGAVDCPVAHHLTEVADVMAAARR